MLLQESHKKALSKENKKQPRPLLPLHSYPKGLLFRLKSLYKHHTQSHIKNRAALVQQGAQPWRILEYRRITNPNQEPYPLLFENFTKPDTFEMQMRYLAKTAHVISLEELVLRIENQETISPTTVVITLSHGWVDHFEHALPVLKHYNLPATFFLATSFIDSMNMFWTDKVLASLILLEAEGVNFPEIQELGKFPEGEAERFGYSMARNLHLIDYLKNRAEPEELAEVLKILGIGLEAVGGLPARRVFMSWEEVQEVAAHGFAIGSQSHLHKEAKQLSTEEFASDVRESLMAIRNLQIKPCPVFCYPEGSVTRKSRNLLYENGIRFALSSGKQGNPSSTNNMAAILGRVLIFDAIANHEDTFAERLWNPKL